MSKVLSQHEYFMKRALDLAKKAGTSVLPNPMVGAVLVKNGKIIAEGYHKKYGGPHAEVVALQKLSVRKISGATLYVSLEPCCHFGKTPPCANFLIKKGVKTLYVAMRDPNPKVSGRGISLLRRAGVQVHVGLLKNEAYKLNRIFVKNQTTSRPFVSIKLGLTLDGKIAQKSGGGLITNDLVRQYVHQLRSQHQALLTTSRTIMTDDPHLGVRYYHNKGADIRDPLRIVLDSEIKTSLKSQVYRDDHVLVFTTSRSSARKRKLFMKHGIEVVSVPGKRISLQDLLEELYRRGISSLMVEAGAELASSLIREKLADELVLFFAPKLLGSGKLWLNDLGIPSLSHAISLHDVRMRNFGDNAMIQGFFDFSS